MPELPDLTIYLESLRERIVGRTLEKIRLASPFLLRSVDPPVRVVENRAVRGIRRIGKQIVLEMEDDLFIVIHLMIAGRFHWKERGAKVRGKINLAGLDFTNGTLLLTEASTKKRASLHVVRGTSSLAEFDRGGLEFMNSSIEQFKVVLRRENHTLKRALTDPRLFSAIGNAYSDEILHRARLSPLRLTENLTEEEAGDLYHQARLVMEEWIRRLREKAGGLFPEKVTAFHKEMAVHGKYGQPCPVCGTIVQRIVYAENECNYCPRCQTNGKLLADRSLSRLLKDDWPRTIEELEESKSISRL